jgi:hypothetical protein
VRQKLQSLHFGTGEAFAAQPPTRGGAELEQIVEQRRGAGILRDCGRDPLHVIDYAIAEAVALTYMVLTSNSVRDRGFHSPSFNFSCTSTCSRPRSS